MTTEDDFDYKCRVQERFVLTDGTQVVRRRADYTVVLRLGDLMYQHMEPLAQEIAEARHTGDPIAMHGDEGGTRGQFILPAEAIAYAKVEMLDPDGTIMIPEPGHALRDDEVGHHRRAAMRAAGIGPRRHTVVRNVRRNDPATG
jgi:hypothetical protein